MEDVFNRLKSGASKAAFEADKLARIAHAQSELAAIKRQIESLYTDLGRAVYELRLAADKDDSTTNAICEKISEQMKLLEQKAQAIESIKAERFGSSSTPPVSTADINSSLNPTTPAKVEEAARLDPASKHCQACGQNIPAEAVFCPLCGKKT